MVFNYLTVKTVGAEPKGRDRGEKNFLLFLKVKPSEKFKNRGKPPLGLI